MGGFMYLGLIVPAYGYMFFAPGIIKTYGYKQIGTHLHSVPPWAASYVFARIIAYFSDLLKHRFLFTLIPIAMSIAGFAILLTTHTNDHLELRCFVPRDNGYLLRAPCHSLLVQLQTRRPSSTSRWHSVVIWLRQHRRHHCYSCFLGERCTVL